MERNKDLKEAYEYITESKKGMPIADKDKAIFERLVHNEKSYLKEQTLSGDMARLGQLLVPVFRRAFPYLIAKDVVGVQPLSQPVGYAFALRYHYAGNTAQGNKALGGKNGFVTGNNLDNQRSDSNSVLAIYTSTAQRQADRADITDNVAVAITSVNGVVIAGTSRALYTEDNKLLLSDLTQGDITALKAAVGETGSVHAEIVDNEQAYLTILKNYPGPTTTALGEALGNDIQELGMSIDKIPIEAQTRKLKARYTLESAQDLKSAHGKDMASEFIDILTYEISQSIDREIIDTINTAAVKSSFNIDSDSDGRWSHEKFRGAFTELCRKSNDIARTTMRGPGNFIIAHTDVTTMIEQMPGFTGVAPVPGTVNTNTPVNQMGTALAGSLGGRFSVYRDIFASGRTATVGYKGASSYDTGVIYSPYIPISMKQLVDQESANPSIIFMERSAVTENIFSSDNYYRQITINGLFGET